MVRLRNFILLILVLSLSKTFALTSEKGLLQAIKHDNIVVLDSFLSTGINVNGRYGNDQMTLLCYAIKDQSYKSFFRLLESGADPNIYCKGKSPLMSCVYYRDLYLMRKLLKARANIDDQNRKGETALIYASKTGKYEFVKTLIQNGADAELRDKSGKSALDLANMNNHVEIATFLAKIIEMRHYYTNLPAYRDGPHIEWRNDSLVRMFYLIYDTIKRFPVINEECFVVKNNPQYLRGFAFDTLAEYPILRYIEADTCCYNNVSKVLSLGDIHGHYPALVRYLKENKIVDEHLKWIWGNGHLVLQGDVVDRGNQVTECLWLIYQLDFQAQRAGGKVHLLLGNHEVMAIGNDTRYLNRKYEFFSNYFFTDYSYFFSPSTMLGKYLRSRNTVVMINGMLYSHAGISPKVIEKQLSIGKINKILRNYIQNPSPGRKSDYNYLITNIDGPLWYRGYVYDIGDVEMITQQQVDSILEFYDATKLIVAHTEVDNITSLYNNKVIAVDVPIRMQDCIPEGLLLMDGKFYLLHCDGSQHPFRID